MAAFGCPPRRGTPSRQEHRGEAVLAGLSPEDREEILARRDSYLGDEKLLRPAPASYAVNHDWEPASEYFLGVSPRRRGGSTTST
jgi:hypothetical protein